MPDIRLITRADDLGSFSGVAPATIDAHRRGIIRNASVMAPTPWFAQAAAAVAAVPSLCLGLHLTICCEWRHTRWRPLLPPEQVPCLVDAEGYFKSDPLRIHQDGVDFAQVLAECQAQLDRVRAHGLDVRYVDSHMCWEWIHAPGGPPRAGDILKQWCRERGLIWWLDAPSAFMPDLPAGMVQHTPRATLLAQAERAPPGTYLHFFHPCWGSASIAAEDGDVMGQVQRSRIVDGEMVSDRQVRRNLERLGVSCVRYDEV